MKILYIGAGYVGACSAAVSADSGHQVLVYDIDKEKIKKLSSGKREEIDSCLFEEDLADLIIRNKERLCFTSDINDVNQIIDQIKIIFMCLPTPEKDGSGETDLTYYRRAINTLSKNLVNRNKGTQSRHVLIINKSTVPIGMAEKIKQALAELGVENFGVGSNPEFLVEGKAVEGSIRPQRIVVGAWEERDFILLREVYQRFYESPKTAYIEVSPTEAEAGKLLANFVLFNRLATCFDVVGRTCEKFSARFEGVRKILISDKRIGDWGFYDSLFAGGSCFIKDSRSLAFQLKKRAAATDLINDTIQANNRQLNIFLSRPQKELGYRWAGKKISLLGLAFKRDTNDIRNSAAVKAADFLLKEKVDSIKAFDPAAGNNFKTFYNNHDKILITNSEVDAIRGSDMVIIAADWPQFRELSEIIKKELPPGALIMDGRRMLQHKYKKLSEAGYNIIAVGSPLIKAKQYG